MPNLQPEIQNRFRTYREPSDRWCTFEEILQRLHRAGIYLHADQLAEFLVLHGLPVDLCHVPPHLRVKAQHINDQYQGDMAQRCERIMEPNFVECYQELGLQPLQLV